MPLKTRLAPKEHMGLTTRQKIKKYRAFYIMFIPLFLCLVLFSYLPMFGILYAFTDYTPFKPASFVGLQNFQSCSPKRVSGKRFSTRCKSVSPN